MIGARVARSSMLEERFSEPYIDLVAPGCYPKSRYRVPRSPCWWTRYPTSESLAMLVVEAFVFVRAVGSAPPLK